MLNESYILLLSTMHGPSIVFWFPGVIFSHQQSLFWMEVSSFVMLMHHWTKIERQFRDESNLRFNWNITSSSLANATCNANVNPVRRGTQFMMPRNGFPIDGRWKETKIVYLTRVIFQQTCCARRRRARAPKHEKLGCPGPADSKRGIYRCRWDERARASKRMNQFVYLLCLIRNNLVFIILNWMYSH